jgi:hypothetical protein
MKNKILIVAITVIAVVSLVVITPVLADDDNANAGAKASSTKDKSDQSNTDRDIDSKINNLNKLVNKISGLKKITVDQKTALSSSTQQLIANFISLKTTMSSSTGTTSINTDKQELIQASRDYALVIPRANIIATANRIETIVSMMNIVGTKLQVRLSQMSSSSDLVSLEANLKDLVTKVAEASRLAQTAINEVITLTPDNGDNTKMTANTATLKSARSKLQLASKALKDAKKDAQIIIQALVKEDKSIMNLNKEKGKDVVPTSTATTSTTTSQ